MHHVMGLRVAVIVVLALAGGGVAAVMRLHWRAWRRLPRGAGLTPLHVALVSAGVLQWGFGLAWALLDALKNPATFSATIRLFLFGSGGLTIIAALIIVGGLQRRKIKFSGTTAQVVVTEVDQVSIDTVRPVKPPHLRRPTGNGPD